MGPRIQVGSWVRFGGSHNRALLAKSLGEGTFLPRSSTMNGIKASETEALFSLLRQSADPHAVAAGASPPYDHDPLRGFPPRCHSGPLPVAAQAQEQITALDRAAGPLNECIAVQTAAELSKGTAPIQFETVLRDKCRKQEQRFKATLIAGLKVHSVRALCTSSTSCSRHFESNPW
jgi:hypothetical protein